MSLLTDGESAGEPTPPALRGPRVAGARKTPPTRRTRRVLVTDWLARKQGRGSQTTHSRQHLQLATRPVPSLPEKSEPCRRKWPVYARPGLPILELIDLLEACGLAIEEPRGAAGPLPVVRGQTQRYSFTSSDAQPIEADDVPRRSPKLSASRRFRRCLESLRPGFLALRLVAASPASEHGGLTLAALARSGGGLSSRGTAALGRRLTGN